MSKVSASGLIQNLKDDDQRWRAVTVALQQIVQVINGNLELNKNIFGTLLDVTFSTANQNVSVTHNLQIPVTGYYVIRSSAAMSVYDGTGENSTTVFSLRSNAVGTATIFMF